MSPCRECRAGLEHCHGTVVHHAQARSECTEAECTTPEALHSFRIDCEAVGCPCGQDVALAV